MTAKKTVKNEKKSYLYKMTNGYNESWKTQSGYLFFTKSCYNKKECYFYKRSVLG